MKEQQKEKCVNIKLDEPTDTYDISCLFSISLSSSSSLSLSPLCFCVLSSLLYIFLAFFRNISNFESFFIVFIMKNDVFRSIRYHFCKTYFNIKTFLDF